MVWNRRRAVVRPMAAMRAHLLTLLCLLAIVARAQRRPPPQVRMAADSVSLWLQEDEDYGRGNRLSGRARSGGQPDLSLDVGQFPYPRGETPVFNFDQGDEVLDINATTLEGIRFMNDVICMYVRKINEKALLQSHLQRGYLDDAQIQNFLCRGSLVQSRH